MAPQSSRTVLAASLLALLAAGCSTLPKERAETPPLPEAWSGAPDAPAAARADWWTGFQDPTLDALVAEAVSTGPDVRLAALRLREARALSRQTVSDFLPELSARASGQYTRAIEGQQLTGSFQSALAGGGLTFEEEQLISSYGPAISWEIPLFSRIEAARLGARANERANAEDVRATRIAVAADVAGAYVELRAAQNREASLREAVAAADQLAAILEISAQAGLAAEAEAADARRLAESARARLPDAAEAVTRAAGVLAVLRGRAPGTETAETAAALAAASGIPRFPLSGPPLTPAEFVRARPDVAQAEARTLVAAADLGIARTDLLPRLNLTGSLGVTSNVVGAALPETLTRFEATPLISIPLFDWGRRMAGVRTRDARFEQALIAYQSTVNNAVAEGSNALVSLTQADLRRTAAERAEAAAARTAEGVRASYGAGIASLADRLRADQQLIDARLLRIEAEAAQARAAIAVYRAFAGGPGPITGA